MSIEFREASLPTKPALKLDEYLPYLVNRVGTALVERFTREALAAHSLSIDMWRVLARLASNDGQRQIDLAAATSIEASTISRIVTRLMRLGFVRRTRSRTSNREVVVQLSPQGRALVKKLIPVALKLERMAVACVSSAELAQLKRSLAKVYESLAAGAP
jgi:DNA-binding MarR family transcriptional regulator